MWIELNGRRIDTPAQDLAGLLLDQRLDGQSVATALNGHFVPRDLRATSALTAGDRVEVLSAMQGG